MRTLDDWVDESADELLTAEFDASGYYPADAGEVVYAFKQPTAPELFAAQEDADQIARGAKLPLIMAVQVAVLARTFVSCTVPVESPRMHFVKVGQKKCALFAALCKHIQDAFGSIFNIGELVQTEKKVSTAPAPDTSSPAASNTSTDTPGS
jgi:hypothetical protein